MATITPFVTHIKNVFIPILICMNFVSAAPDLQPRQEFSIPLSRLTMAFDEKTKKYLHVKILQSNLHDQAIISGGDDTYIKSTQKGTEKSVFRESPEASYQLSSFEMKEIDKVCKGLTETLEIFEQDLKDRKFAKCRYLDAFFPRFLKNFSILFLLAKNSDDYKKLNTLLPDSLFDVSQSSPKTDSRIYVWQSTPDYTMKLRIISKELVYQIKQWQKKEVNDSNRNPEISKYSIVEEALYLFIKAYFNFPADLQSIPER